MTKIFNINKEINFYRSKYKYYIVIDSTYFGEQIRFGDFIILTNLLLIVKLHLIEEYDFITFDNFFFYFNNKRNVLLQNFNKLLKLYSNIYDQSIAIDSNIVKNNNFSQILPKANIWFYKCYIDNCNYKIDDDNRLLNFNDTEITKNTVYILPVLNKSYNRERNWSFEKLSTIIDSIDKSDNIKIISLDNYKLNKNNEAKLKEKRGDIIFLKNVEWLNIIQGVALTCNRFISGDCGFSHYVASLHNPYKPKSIEIFYNTKGLKEQVKFTENFLINKDVMKLSSQVNFKPISLYNSNIRYL